MRASTLFLLATLCGSSVACANAELEQKVKELEEKNAALDRDLKAAKQAERGLEQRLAQAQKAPPSTPKLSIEDASKALGVKPGEKIFATFETSMGTLVAEIYWEKAPATALNFVQLAEGTKEWTDPKSNQKVKRPLYDGTIFHRVIPDFMIQGGDPAGTGAGGPGYRFDDEFTPDLRHVGPGILSMANSGRNTNGSQFFITEKDTPWLDDRHSVFGKMIEGLDLIPKITRVEKSDGPKGSKPKVDVVLKKVTIGRGAPKK
jgi:peptidyl-prolyl cis-trans isomerase A (cyclophilin A)